jgi:hypothetical protein
MNRPIKTSAVGAFSRSRCSNAVKKTVLVAALLCGAAEAEACDDLTVEQTRGAAKICLDIVHKLPAPQGYAPTFYSTYDAYYQTGDGSFPDNAVTITGPRFEFYKCLTEHGVALSTKK